MDLHLENISFSYPNTKVLKDVSLKLQKGTITAIMGPNGCGKSTLLRLISQKAGGAGVVFQEDDLLPWLSVKDNIALSRKPSLKGLFPEIEQYAHLFPFELSGGMKKKVAIARALSYNKDILLLDEAFSMLDEFSKKHRYKKLKQIKNQGTAIVIVSHSISEAAFLSDNVVILSKRPATILKIFRKGVDEKSIRNIIYNS